MKCRFCEGVAVVETRGEAIIDKDGAHVGTKAESRVVCMDCKRSTEWGEHKMDELFAAWEAM